MDGCEAITCHFSEAKLLSSGFVSSPKPRVPEGGIESDEQAFTLPINFRNTVSFHAEVPNLGKEHTGLMEQTKRTAELTRSFNRHSLLSLSAHPTDTLRSHQAHLKSLMASRQRDISARAHDAPVREYELVHAKRSSPGADEGLKRTA